MTGGNTMEKKTDHDIFMEVWKDCETSETVRKWEKQKEELDQAFGKCKESLASAWETVNEVCGKYGWPRKQG